MGGESGRYAHFDFGRGFAVCPVLMIALGAVDLHQGFGELEWDIHQWGTTQSRGARE